MNSTMRRQVLAVAAAVWMGFAAAVSAADYTAVTREVQDKYRATIQDFSARLEAGAASDAEKERYLRERGVARSNLDLNEEAVADFTEAIEIAPTEVSHYIDRSFLYEKLGRDEPANRDLEFALGLKPDDFWAHRGKASLAMKRQAFDEAANFFARGLHGARGDETLYGVIWTSMALGRAGRPDWSAVATSVLTRIGTRQWPVPVLELYAGKITPEQLLQAAVAGDARLNRDQMCEAYYYLAEFHLIAGERDKAREALNEAIGTGVLEFVEHFWAKRELGQLGTP